MKLAEYQQKAIAFANPNLSPEMAIATRGMGLAGETGELIDLLKKHLEQGHPLDFEKVKKELGDCLWYLNAIAFQFRISLVDIVPRNPYLSAKVLITQNLLRLDSVVGRVSDWIEFHLENGGDSNLDIALERVLYRLMAIAHHFGFTLEEIADANLEKLTARYGDRFSVERSLNRVGEV